MVKENIDCVIGGPMQNVKASLRAGMDTSASSDRYGSGKAKEMVKFE